MPPLSELCSRRKDARKNESQASASVKRRAYSNPPADAKPHWELTSKYDIIDFELGAKPTGAGLPFGKVPARGDFATRARLTYFWTALRSRLCWQRIPATDSCQSRFRVMEPANCRTKYVFRRIKRAAGWVLPDPDWWKFPLPTITWDALQPAGRFPFSENVLTPAAVSRKRKRVGYGKMWRWIVSAWHFNFIRDVLKIVRIQPPDKSAILETPDTVRGDYEAGLLSRRLCRYAFRILQRLCGGGMSLAFCANPGDFRSAFPPPAENMQEVGSSPLIPKPFNRNRNGNCVIAQVQINRTAHSTWMGSAPVSMATNSCRNSWTQNVHRTASAPGCQSAAMI